MKQIMKTKIARKVLVMAFLAVGLAAVLSDSSRPVGATLCSDAFTAYSNADFAYYTARVLYINGSPTTCAQNCSGNPNYSTCVSNCQTTRATDYYSAELDMFSKAGQTCAPEGIMYTCQDAVNAAAACVTLYDYNSYEDPDENWSVYNQYLACRQASKVDTCQ